jgi:MYXO-CTERM domain-containing protein
MNCRLCIAPSHSDAGFVGSMQGNDRQFKGEVHVALFLNVFFEMWPASYERVEMWTNSACGGSVRRNEEMRVTPSVLAIALASGVAATGSAQTPISVDRTGYDIFDSSQITITATSLSSWSESERQGNDVYSSLGTDGTFGFSSTSTGPSALIDDYTGDGSAGNIFRLRFVTFVGGVSNAGDIIYFDFFSVQGLFISGFGVMMPNTLNQVWTFNVNSGTTQPVGSNQIDVLNSGFLQIAGDDGSLNDSGLATNLRWFETNEVVDIGSNDAPTIFAFQVTGVPTPGAVALFGLAGLAAVRRRR